MSAGARRRRRRERVFHAPELAEVTPEPRRGLTEEGMRELAHAMLDAALDELAPTTRQPARRAAPAIPAERCGRSTSPARR